VGPSACVGAFTTCYLGWVGGGNLGEGGLGGEREKLRWSMALRLKLLSGGSLIHRANAIGLSEIFNKR